ncbi:hypothetical protein K8S17_06350 [bacterium]|nr:hypothetical protein [bacterium]
MMRVVTVFVMGLAAALGGCGGAPGVSGSEEPTATALPEWVLVVPFEEEGRNVYVGGCVMALSAAEGIELARTDAEQQIASRAHSGFIDIFARAPRASGVTTTSIDRLDFKELGLRLYPDAMAAAASVDRIYLKSCSSGALHEGAGPPGEGEMDGAVCSVFVRVSVEADAWERQLSEAVQEMRHHFAAADRQNLARLADWVDDHLPELLSGETRADIGTDVKIR